MRHTALILPEDAGWQLEQVRTQIIELERCLARIKTALPEAPAKRTDPIEDALTISVDPARIRSIIVERRRREKELGPQLFADPAWDIMLEALVAELEQRRMSVSDHCLCSAVPTTTALRWVKKLEQDGWLVRKADAFDARRHWMELSFDASARLRRYFERVNAYCI